MAETNIRKDRWDKFSIFVNFGALLIVPRIVPSAPQEAYDGYLDYMCISNQMCTYLAVKGWKL